MKRTYITLCLALMSLTAMWGETVATSPDGRIVVDFEVKDGRPMYSVLYDGQVAIAPSAMGLHTNMGDYTGELAWNASDVRKGEFSGTCTLPSIKAGAEHNFLYSHSVLSLSQKERPVMEIEFMVSNRDVAFRYTILPRRDVLSLQKLRRSVSPQMPALSLLPKVIPWEDLHARLPATRRNTVLANL